MKEYTITSLDANQKILKFVKKNFDNVSLSVIHKVFRKKDVKVNGKRVDENYVLKENDQVIVYMPEFLIDPINQNIVKKVEITFEVVYEDAQVLIVNKPIGLLSVEDDQNKNNHLANQVLYYLKCKNEYNEENKSFTPAPVHRIDRNTSGLVIIAKTMVASQILTKIIKEKAEIEKEYLALVKGKVLKQGKIDKPLVSDKENKKVSIAKKDEKGLSALTYYDPIEFYGDFTLLKVILMTGRTHQIRVHLSYIGHPIIGDAKYGDFAINKLIKSKYKWENQFLHAKTIKFGLLPDELAYLSDTEFKAPLLKAQEDLLIKLQDND